MLFTSLLASIALPLLAVAQVPTNASSISPCIISCSTIGATAGGCSSFADYACICASTAAQQAAGACLQANCTGVEVNAAAALQNATCSTLNTASNASTSASGVIASITASASSLAGAASSGVAKLSSATATATAKTGAGFEIAHANSLLALGGAIFVGAGALLL